MPPVTSGSVHDLGVPIYLDSSAMLDLLASIDDGFSIVERVTTRASTSADRDISVSASSEAGGLLSNIFKIGVSGALTTRKGHTGEDQNEAERYHTHGSLLHKLRRGLDESEILKVVNSNTQIWNELQPSDFIEIRGRFTPNPLVHSMKMLARTMEMLEVISELGGVPGSTPSQTRQGSSKKSTPSLTAEQKSLRSIRAFMDQILSDMDHNRVHLMIMEPANHPQFRVVAALTMAFLRDETMNELIDGDYRLFGQVTRVLRNSSDTGINLLRGSVLGTISENILQQLTDALNTSIENDAWRLPPIVTSIEPPVIQVLPIAIYA